MVVWVELFLGAEFIMRYCEPTGDPLEDIPAMLAWRGGGVTFVELLRFVPYLQGDLQLFQDDNPTVVLWEGVSQACIDALATLEADALIELKPVNPLIYVLDSFVPRRAIATARRRYKELRWRPITFVLTDKGYAHAVEARPARAMLVGRIV